MKKPVKVALVAIPVIVAAAIAAMAIAGGSACPGTKICPLTGEVVCIDRCPVDCGGASAAAR